MGEVPYQKFPAWGKLTLCCTHGRIWGQKSTRVSKRACKQSTSHKNSPVIWRTSPLERAYFLKFCCIISCSNLWRDSPESVTSDRARKWKKLAWGKIINHQIDSISEAKPMEWQCIIHQQPSLWKDTESWRFCSFPQIISALAMPWWCNCRAINDLKRCTLELCMLHTDMPAWLHLSQHESAQEKMLHRIPIMCSTWMTRNHSNTTKESYLWLVLQDEAISKATIQKCLAP